MLLEKYKSEKVKFTAPEYLTRYDGNKWSYHAILSEENKKTKTARGLGIERCGNVNEKGKAYFTAYHFGGFSYRRPMNVAEIKVAGEILKADEVSDKEKAAYLAAKGFAENLGDRKIKLLVPYFTKDEKEKFDKLRDEIMVDVMGDYTEAFNKYVKGYIKLFPKHLEAEVLRAAENSYISLFATQIVKIAQEKGLLKIPHINSCCEVIIET